MTDLYLRFSDKDEAMEVLAFAVRGGEWVHATHDWALDPIGELVLEPAVLDAAGFEVVTPAVYAEGYHVNLRVLNGWNLPDLSAYEVAPKSPRRVWA